MTSTHALFAKPVKNDLAVPVLGPIDPLHPPETEALRWERFPGFYRPDYARCLTGVMPTILDVLGHPRAGFPTLRAYLPERSPRRAKRALLLCCDGLGFKELAQSVRLRRLCEDYGTWITSVFPSITSCALSSMFQGLPPDRHGILGHYVWKDFPGAVVDMLKMQAANARSSLVHAGFDVQRWKREPGLLDTDGGHGLSSYHLMHHSIVTSGLSTYSYGRSVMVGYLEILEGFTKAAKFLAQMPRGWVSLYTATVDTLSHSVGGSSSQVGLAVRQIEESLAWMVDTLPREVAEDTVILLAADHGQTDIRTLVGFAGETRDWLQAHTKAVGFSGRVLHVYLNPGQPPGEVHDWLSRLVGDAGAVLSFEEAARLAGPAGVPASNGHGPTVDPAWVRQSLGDIVVVLDGDRSWDKEGVLPTGKQYTTPLVSQHGGLTWNEMFVPFLCAPLTEAR
jgi:catechol 2,3-dioxygenase-like lactoylglutathione lyase family enzyme